MRLANLVAIASILSIASTLSIAGADDPPPRCAAGDAVLRIHCLLDTGRYPEAERVARDWHETITHTSAGSLDELRAGDALVEALLAVGKSGKQFTVTLAEDTLRAKQRLLPASDAEVAASLENLAAVYNDRGEFRRAVSLHREALSIRERLLPSSDPLIATTLESLAESLVRLEQLTEARAILERAARIGEPGAAATSATARFFRVRALLEKYEGNYSSGLSSVDRALRIQDGMAPDHPDTGAALQLRGDLLLLSGDIEGANAAWMRALDITTSTLGSEHPLVPLLLRELAFAASALGELSQAHGLLERALLLGQQVLPPCHQELPAALDDFATLVQYDGDYQRARNLFAQAFTIRQRCLGPNHSLTATVVHNQALLAATMGDLLEAERLHERALRMWSTGLGTDHPFVARALEALADTVASRGDVRRARALYARSLAIKRRVLGGHHPDVASTLTRVAALALADGDVKNATAELSGALAIYQEGGRPQEPDYLARALELRATIELRRGDFMTAHATYAEALAARQQIFGTNHPLTAESAAHMAATMFALGSHETALQSALTAESIGRDHLRFTIRYLPERQAMAYAAARPHGLDLALSIAVVDRALDAAPVFDAEIRSRGVILDELAARARSTSGPADAQLAALNARLTAARQRFATLMLRSLEGTDTVPPRLIDESRQQKEDAERAMAERSIAAREEAKRAQTGLDDVRDALPAGSAVVSFVRYNRTTLVNGRSGQTIATTPSYIALVTRPDTDDVRVTPLGTAASLERLINAWRAEASGGSLATAVAPKDAERAYRTAAAALRARVWDPLTSSLTGATRVFIVPDGALNLVSFAALPVGNRYLLENGPAIHYLATERDLVRLDAAAGRGLLALGAPAFDLRAPNTVATVRGSGCGTIGALRFEDLPGSRSEIQDIARFWASHDEVLVLSGRGATKAALTRAVAGRKVVHLATHGFFLGPGCDAATIPNTRGVGGLAAAAAPARADNPLLFAGLALAGVNTLSGAKQANAILNAEEIAGLNLQGTEWAVLSACDTGLGQITAGEGVFGLRRAFQIAGVHTIIMSLWSVEDRSTRDWMKALYEARLTKQVDTPDAVRSAGIQVLAQRRAHGQSTHPFYWAAFVAAGDWH